MRTLPLYKQIQEDIRFLIRSGKLRPGDRVQSETELAEHYHVSKITTKNAINGLAEEGVLVRHRGKGTFVSPASHESTTPSRHNGIVGLILPSMKTKVDQRMINAIEQYVRVNGYYLLIKITQESPLEESRAIEELLQLRIKGLIVFPIEQKMYNNDILQLSLNRFPLVLIDRYMKEIETYSVSADNLEGSYRAVSHLIDKGHKHIAFITVRITNSVTAERAMGFEKAYLERNETINKNLWCVLSIDDIATGKGISMIQEFLREHPEVTAVFTVNAELTSYTYRAINSRDAAASRAIEMMSFDQSEIVEIGYVKQNVEEMCRLTIELLLEQMNGSYNPRRLVVPVALFHKKYT